jgi:hypothetical protein
MKQPAIVLLALALTACSSVGAPARLPSPTDGTEPSSMPALGSPATGSEPTATAPPRPAEAPSPVSPSPAGESATPPPDVEAIQDRVIEAVNADWANFGGVYLERDGTLVIQYVGANAGRAAVEEVLEPGVSVRWEQVERSRADLMAILREVRDRDLEGVVAVGIDTINNQVEVTVDPSQHFDEVSQILGSEYSDAVAVVAGEPMVADPGW